MTSVCVGSVASQPKAGVPDRIYLDTQYMSSILPVQLEWMRPFLPYLPPIFVDVAAFCAAEPPAQPSLVEATFAAVLAGGEFGAALVAAELILQEIQAQLWYVICECSSGTQPTAPTAPSPPSGLVQVNPPTLVQPNPVTPCLSLVSQNETQHVDLFYGLFPHGGGNNTLFEPMPKGTTLVKLTTQVIAGGGSDTALLFRLTTRDALGNALAPLPQTSQAIGSTVTRTLAINAAHVEFQVDASPPTSVTSTSIAHATVDFYCGGAPGQPQTPCCPPDPVITGMLTQILNYVTLIQRQAVPFGYVLGTQHTALSGAGALSISGLLGVKVEVTTLPTSYGVAGTSPPEHFDLGFITFGVADGFPSAFRLTRNPQFMTPARCSVYTDLDYDLAPGVVVTITEIRREF